jgi:hypothetical protein
MIRPSYAIKLAGTKLRSKRGMLTASILISSLLFAGLIAMVIVFTGAEKSATEFVKKAGNDRYLVKASPNIPYEKVALKNPLSVESIREIKAQEKQYYSELKQKYKSLNVPYDASLEVSALIPSAFLSDESTPEEARVMINWQSPVIQVINAQRFDAYTATAINKLPNLKEIGAKYGAEGYYKADASSMLAGIPSLRLVQSGKEDFSVKEAKADDLSIFGYYTNAMYNSSYGFTDQKLLSRFLLTTDASSLKGIPVVVSAQEATSLFGKDLGVSDEPQEANAKKIWLESVQSKLKDYTYQTCYRNSAEQELLDKIQRDYAEIKGNEGNKDYVKPTLQYKYPTKVCGDIAVQSDTRSIDQKKADATEIENQKKLGTYVAPGHKLLTFQIVGIQYAQRQADYSKGVDEYINNLLAPQEDYSSSLDIPIQMYNALPETLKFDDLVSGNNSRTTQDFSATEDFTPRVLEFPTVDAARSFLANETCSTAEQSCSKKFIASPYGSNYLILDEIGKLFNKVAAIAFPVVLALAGIIIWLTVTRIMAENRKETSVYRAMGAKRKDVASIYLFYILQVATLIAVVSFAIGITGAFVIDYLYGNDLSDSAAAAFGIINNAPSLSLFNIDSPYLVLILILIFLISLLASIQPLTRNTLRSPVRDMREE